MAERQERLLNELHELELKEMDGLLADHRQTTEALGHFQGEAGGQPAEFVKKDIPVDKPLTPSRVLRVPAFAPPSIPALLVNPLPAQGAMALEPLPEQGATARGPLPMQGATARGPLPMQGATAREPLPMLGATAAYSPLRTPPPHAQGQVSATLREPPTVQRQVASPSATTNNIEMLEPSTEDGEPK